MAIYYSDSIKKVYEPTVTSSTSRYDTKIRLVHGNQKSSIRFIRSRDINFNNDESTIHIVTPIEAFRPDLIAYKYYGSSTYSWIILSANKLSLPYQLVAGMKILIPALQALQGRDGKLVTR